MRPRLKPIAFCGDSLNELRAFPEGARQEAGFQLYRVQPGLDPADWKPMATIGRGVREIRIRDEAGAYRVMYIATFTEAVYVCTHFRRRRNEQQSAMGTWQPRGFGTWRGGQDE